MSEHALTDGEMELLCTYKDTSLYAEYIQGVPFLHLNFDDEWSIRTYRNMLRAFGIVCSRLKDEGYEDVMVLIPKDEHLLKFEKMFGFEVEVENDEVYVLARSL